MNESNQSSFHYEGHFNNELRVELAALLQLAARSNEFAFTSIKRLCLVAIELLDNAQRHKINPQVTFRWLQQDGALEITVVNNANEEDALRLRELVDRIHGLNVDELNVLYKKQLQNLTFSDKGGAGLGLLQIARKSYNKISAKVVRMENGSYLCTSSVLTSIN